MDNLSNQTHYFELFNTGIGMLKYEIKAPDYILIDHRKGSFEHEKRIYISVDWAKAPIGIKTSLITVSGSDGSKITFNLRTKHNKGLNKTEANLFIPQNGYIAMEAANYSKAVNSRPIYWKNIPNYGKTSSGVISVPVTAGTQNPDKNTAHLLYDV